MTRDLSGAIKYGACFFFALLLVSSSACRVNRFDRKGLRQGPWREYADNSRKKYFSRGRFRHDAKVGTWYYYTAAGQLERKEKFRKRGSLIHITYYHPGGGIASHGKAQVVEEGDVLHYYWYGEWKYYDASGKLEKSKTFLMGTEIHTEYPGNKP